MAPTSPLEVDDVISATGFVAPLLDLPELGVQTVGQSRLPVQTPFWESTTVPGIFFGGTIGQGAKGLQKHGVPANSGAVHGARYNARVLAARIAQTHFGDRTGAAPPRDRGDRRASSARELAEAPELFHQRGYLARVLTADPAGGMRDDGVQPLAYVLDEGGPDAIAATLEGDGSGAIYPVLYSRIGGKVVEHAIEPDPLMRFDTIDSRRAILDLVGRVATPLGADGEAGQALRGGRRASRAAWGRRSAASSGRAPVARRTTNPGRPRRPGRR